jgi:predicted DNA-binding transcriptional regulator AlpA
MRDPVKMWSAATVMQNLDIKSATTLREMIRRDGFPEPYELIRGKRHWSSTEVQEWLRQRMAAQRNGGRP